MYRILAKFELLRGGSWQIRQYDPCKRTIVVANRHYFIQIPYYTAVVVSSGVPSLHALAFNSERFDDLQSCRDKMLYWPPLPHVYSPANRFVVSRICSGQGIKVNNFDDAVSSFWLSAFQDHSYLGASAVQNLANVFGSMESWQQLHLDEVLTNIQKTEKCTLNQLIESLGLERR